jgi:Kef-type K+ transport system membrane component KefB
MLDHGLLESLGWIVLAAAIFAVVAAKIRLPVIVAFLFAGVLIGPVLGLVEPSEALRHIAEVGIVLLLFLVGLELDFGKIRDVGRVAVIAGLGQVVFTAAGGFAFAWLLGFGAMEATFLAVGLTFSSTVVVVKVLTDKGELDSLYGRIAVGIFLVQDLVVIVALTILSGLSGGGELDVDSVGRGLAGAVGGMALLLVGVLVAARFALPGPFRWAARSPSTLFVWSLAWCFVVVATAYLMSLSVEIGAFLAGLSLAQLPYNRDLQHRIKPLMNFFVAVFFVALGIRMEPAEALVHWWPIVAFSLFVLIGNPLIFMLIISRLGYSERTSFLTSVTVAQISEFSFIFAAMGVASGLVGESVMAITAMVGVITIALSAYLILYNEPLYRALRRLRVLEIFRARQEREDAPDVERADHIIVIGMNTLGRGVAAALHDRGETVVAVDLDPRKLVGLPCETLLGNVEYRDVMEELGLARAKLVVSALRIEDFNELIAFRCREAAVPCAITAIDLSTVENLLELDVAYLMLPKVDGVKLQARELSERGLIDA